MFVIANEKPCATPALSKIIIMKLIQLTVLALGLIPDCTWDLHVRTANYCLEENVKVQYALLPCKQNITAGIFTKKKK